MSNDRDMDGSRADCRADCHADCMKPDCLKARVQSYQDNTRKFEEFLRSEIEHAEQEKERTEDGPMRMAFVGQIAAFKGALYAFHRLQKEQA